MKYYTPTILSEKVFIYKGLKPAIILMLLVSNIVFSQLSTIHYIPPLTASDNRSSQSIPRDQYIYISTPSIDPVNFKLIPVGNLATEINGQVSKGNSYNVLLESSYGQLFVPSSNAGQVHTNKGYIIEADSPVYVSIRFYGGNAFRQAGALVSKGDNALGTQFRVGTAPNKRNVIQGSTELLGFVSVMATENNTQVEFTGIESDVILRGYSGPVDPNGFGPTLNRGESFILALNSNDNRNNPTNWDALIGALVSANKPIVVNTGYATGSFQDAFTGRDMGTDQIVDASKIGSEYIFVRGEGKDEFENILIVAHTDNTDIYIDNNIKEGPTLNAGEYHIIEGDKYSSAGNLYVATTQPVFAYQNIGGSRSTANQGFFFAPPLSCNNSGELKSIANIEKIGDTRTLQGSAIIISNSGITPTLTSSSSTAPIPLPPPSTVIGNSNYVTYTVTGLEGDISVESDGEIYVAYYNRNGNATSGAFYTGFPPKPTVELLTDPSQGGICPGNIVLKANASSVFTNSQWQFDGEGDDDGDGLDDEVDTDGDFVDLPNGKDTDTFTPLVPGFYRFVGILQCGQAPIEIPYVVVSSCPNDYDNDGVEDILDQDIDNDGIFNCDESAGNATLNLSNFATPILEFDDGTTNSNLSNTILSQDGILSYNGLGNYTSILNDGNGKQSNAFTLKFNQPNTIKLSEDTSKSHSATFGETFVVSIRPYNKTLRLINTDNVLLVDSDFDGFYESNVTTMSSIEIRFRFNPSVSSGSFTFLADAVDEITFEHETNNTVSPSSFYGNLSVRCFGRDDDLDGVYDAYDLDSDNDGIPDYIENNGINLPPLYLDSDGDGLDNAYEPNGVSPIDSDFDGVNDANDLDSDNDGIYDIIESGFTNMDTDGMVDGGVGNNGWADDAEAVPDSFLNLSLAYAINDQDRDLTYNYKDSNSDGDNCSDVLEAGFSDGNTDDYLGDTLPIVSNNGIVINAIDGYTTPNPEYLDFETITYTPNPLPNTIPLCQIGNYNITITNTNADNIQWEILTPSNTIWTALDDADPNYNGVTTNTLELNNIPSSFIGNRYRAVLIKNSLPNCPDYTNEVTLTQSQIPVAGPIPPEDLITCLNVDFDNAKIRSAIINGQTNIRRLTFSYGTLTNQANLPSASVVGTQRITASLENNDGCISRPVSFNITINPLPPIFSPNPSLLETCQGVPFDTAAIKDQIRNGQSDVVVTFSYGSEDNVSELPSATLAVTHFVTATVTNNNNCFNTLDLQLTVNPLPNFQVESPRVICFIEGIVTPITLEPIHSNNDEAFFYEWRWTTADGSITDQFLSNTRRIEINQSGEYTITLTNVRTGCFKSNRIIVDSSQKPVIPEDAVVITDLSNNNSVTIIPELIGDGEYEYALVRAGDNDRNYQDTPFFDNLSPDFYTVYVRDRFCGETGLDIPLVGFPKFFTPNGDGQNDTWQIKGFSSNSNVGIQIFNRFGKLLKTIGTNDIGWDGTSNGKKLPSGDYWFTIFFNDGRKFSDHFTLKQ